MSNDVGNLILLIIQIIINVYLLCRNFCNENDMDRFHALQKHLKKQVEDNDNRLKKIEKRG